MLRVRRSTIRTENIFVDNTPDLNFASCSVLDAFHMSLSLSTCDDWHKTGCIVTSYVRYIKLRHPARPLITT